MVADWACASAFDRNTVASRNAVAAESRIFGIERSLCLPRIFNRPELWQAYEAVNKSIGSH
jgi:hypothetical protein